MDASLRLPLDDGAAAPAAAERADIRAAVPAWLCPFADMDAVHSDEGGRSGVGLRCSLAQGTETDELPKRRPNSDSTDELGASGEAPAPKRASACHAFGPRCGGTKSGGVSCAQSTDESDGVVEPDAGESLRHTTAFPLAMMMARGRCVAELRALPTMAAPELVLAVAALASRSSADGLRDSRPLGDAEPDRRPDRRGDMGDVGGVRTWIPNRDAGVRRELGGCRPASSRARRRKTGLCGWAREDAKGDSEGDHRPDASTSTGEEAARGRTGEDRGDGDRHVRGEVAAAVGDNIGERRCEAACRSDLGGRTGLALRLSARPCNDGRCEGVKPSARADDDGELRGGRPCEVRAWPPGCARALDCSSAVSAMLASLVHAKAVTPVAWQALATASDARSAASLSR